MLKNDYPRYVHGLYIDFKGLIHPFCPSEEDPNVAARSVQEKIDNICDDLDALVSDVRPKRILYIAVDGVAPRAKMMQQRSRRYVHSAIPARKAEAKLRSIKAAFRPEEHARVLKDLKAAGVGLTREALSHGSEDSSDASDILLRSLNASSPSSSERVEDMRKFDKNCISPGTEFMEALCVGVRAHVERKLASGERTWAGLTVIFSDANTPCEGEHKIINFLRGRTAHREFCDDEGGAHVLVGTDADLIFLGLSLHLPRIVILRHWNAFKNDLTMDAGIAPTEDPGRACREFFYLDAVANALLTEIYELCRVKGHEMSREVKVDTSSGAPLALRHRHLIDDFIILAMILGNDFIPRLPGAFCLDGALDNALEVYVMDVLPHGYLTLEDREINLEQLARFFRGYAKVEVAKFRYFYINATSERRRVTAGRFGNPTDMLWWEPYYKSTSISPERVEEACRSYIDMMRFVWRYYSRGITHVSWSCVYDFYHAPFALDLCKFLIKHGKTMQDPRPIDPADRIPIDPLTQLLCILPPPSCDLLATGLRSVMREPPSHLRETFPRSFNVDFTGVGKDKYDAVAMLPPANVAGLQKVVEDAAESLTEEERRRRENHDFHLVFARADQEPFCFNKGDSLTPRAPREHSLRCYEFREGPCPPSLPLRRAFIPPPRHRSRMGSTSVGTNEKKINPYRMVRGISADWLCSTCLLLNYPSYEACFKCHSAYDPSRCATLYCGKKKYFNSLMNPNHAEYIRKYIILNANS
ncbi:unnamed protein product [Phytomonas sp. EM1]|nr:unnamed protein product [Phytomonas sp. EM1]|eukprot:CCW65680.1 unnamed protein product [Phytomonas sp. isolate EM1]